MYVAKHGIIIPEHIRCTCGLDIDDMVKDSSVLAKRFGNFVHPLVSWQKQDVTEVGDLVKDNLHKNHITDVAILYCDGTGVGAGTARYITRQYNLPAVKVTGYFSNLINREELHGYWRAGQLLATGECRRLMNIRQNMWTWDL